MISLGTCNFNYRYNNSFIDRYNCLKLLDFYYKNDGRIIDTASNYHSHEIISEWLKISKVNDFKIVTKIWNEEDLDKCFIELDVEKIFCVMVRDSKNTELLNKVKSYQNRGWIEKVGVSIYYENELRQDVNSFIIPADLKFMNDIKTMILHADVYVRSLYNFIPDKNINSAKELFDFFKRYERNDLNHKIIPLIGVSNIKQLEENLKVFKENT